MTPELPKNESPLHCCNVGKGCSSPEVEFCSPTPAGLYYLIMQKSLCINALLKLGMFSTGIRWSWSSLI